MNDEAQPSRWLFWLLAGHSIVHFALGFVAGLSVDEAHYALYGALPALSYYDHPPLVGWIQMPLALWHTPDGVLRLIPEVLWVLTALIVYSTAQRLNPKAGENAGLWTVLAYSLAPLLHVLGMGLVPDSLLMFFTAALVWQTLRLMDTAKAQGLGDWLLLGLLLGLAGLSKYTAIFAALPVALCILKAHGLRVLKSPGPWLALALAVVLVSPVFIWNAQHDWISFRYQIDHGQGKGKPWRLEPMLLFLLTQVALYPLFIAGSLKALKVSKALLSFFLVPFIVLIAMSGGGSSLPHWTAPAWVALAPFTGLGLATLWQQGLRRRIWIFGAWQGLATLALYALMLLGGPPWQHGKALDDTSSRREEQNFAADLYGWDAAGLRAAELARTNHIDRLAVRNWTLASRLAWYASPLPVHVLAPGDSQFVFWYGPMPQGGDAVLVDWSQLPYRVPEQFAQCELADTLPVHHAGRLISHFTFYVCRNWK
jgi:4-amino-4-deoxy-L-arabinose transferase-like glycosyltransferase